MASAPVRQPQASPDLLLVLAATSLNLGIAVLLVAMVGTGKDGTELALRMTARVSFVWFLAAFLARPLNRLWANSFTQRLREVRRPLGIAFGLSMAIHVAFILRLYALFAPDRPPMVTDADFAIGVPGLILVAILTGTSAYSVRRRISPRVWERLHSVGIWVVWAIFFLCLIDSVGRKQTDHPFLAYYSFLAALLLAAGVRLYAGRQTVP